MRSALVPLVLLLAAPALAGSPTRAALRKSFEANRDLLVEVVGPHRSGPGVVVGSSGQVLTAVEFVGLETARVRKGGKELPARVLMANAQLKVALVRIESAGESLAPAVRLTGVAAGESLLAITRSRKGEPVPHVYEVSRAATEETPFLEVDGPIPVGTPLFDAQGKLVALAVSGGRRGWTRALPVPALRVELASGTKP